MYDLTGEFFAGAVRQHKIWLETGGNEGTLLHLDQAKLTNRHFKEFNLELASFKSVLFEDCSLSDWYFKDTRFLNCSFIRCTFKETTFADCWFRNVQFHDCFLTRARITGCAASGLTLTGRSKLNAAAEIAGFIYEPEQPELLDIKKGPLVGRLGTLELRLPRSK